jgi:ATP-binding cassette subfamily B protein
MVERWLSATIGEGLIYDLRSALFDHVQRQPIAFFTRTQTGALVSRTEQRRDRRPAGRHRHARHGRVQRRHPGHHPRRHAHPRVALTALSLLLLPIFLLPAKRVGRRLAGHHP